MNAMAESKQSSNAPSDPFIQQEPDFQFSESETDDDWDSFLLASKYGHFQQSTAWGRVKKHDGWNVLRVQLRSSGKIIGGVQLLWKQMLGITVGFINKGPVVEEKDCALALQLIQKASEHIGITMLQLQVPDEASVLQNYLNEHGFVTQTGGGIISATVIVDVRSSEEAIRMRYSASCRKQLRKLWKEGLVIQPGNESDAGRFFELMQATCSRHQTAPSPASAEGVALVLREFAKSQKSLPEVSAELLFCYTSSSNAPQCGQISIRFGRRVTAWKKGSNSNPESIRLTRLMEDALIIRAHEQSANYYDFMGISRLTAIGAISNNGRNDAAINMTDAFKLSFGGVPVLLPQAVRWSPNPLVRYGLKLIGKYQHRRMARM